jgi:hypothetical protein
MEEDKTKGFGPGAGAAVWKLDLCAAIVSAIGADRLAR